MLVLPSASAPAASVVSDRYLSLLIVTLPCAGKVPFRDGSEYLTFQKILALDYTFPASFPPVAQAVVQRLLVIDPGLRLGATRRCLPLLIVSDGCLSPPSGSYR